MISWSILILSILNRSKLELTIHHDRNPVFVKLSNGNIRNGYYVNILNKTHSNKNFKLSLQDVENAEIKSHSIGKQSNKFPVLANSVSKFRIFVDMKNEKLKRKKITFIIEDEGSELIQKRESIFINGKI